jgi:DNA repair exonuclease SbcCD ATPase subunit
MKWTKLTAKNFLSFQELTLKLDNRGIVLVEGQNLTSSKFKSNGSGKSSLLEPIVYAIYDTTSKGIKADEVINNKVGKNTVVILEGYKGEDLYRIERYRKHYKQKNKVKLFVNDEEITGKSAAETNKMIEKIVGIDYNTFINSIMFTQGSGAGRFAIATDKEKKEILENLINLHVYGHAQDIAKSRVKAKDEEIVQKQREGERLNWELAQVDTLEQQDRENYDRTRQMIEQESNNYKATLDALEKFARDNITTVNILLEEIEELKKQREGMTSTSDVNTYANEVNRLSKLVNDNKNKQQQLEYQKADIVGKYKKLQTNTNCPICGTPLDTTHRDKEMAELKEQLRGVLIQIQTLQAELTPIEEEYDKAYAEYEEVREKHDSFISEFRNIDNQIKQKEQWLQSYETSKQSYHNRMESIKGTLEKLRSVPEPSPRDAERKAINDKIKAQREQLLALQKEKNLLEDTVKVYSNAGVKSHVLDLKTPFLNERANKYLAMLSGPDMEVKFSTQTELKSGEKSEKFDVQLTNNAGGENYKSNSEGEKKRADLSIALALQDLVMNRAESAVNFAVYDEVFDALDNVGAENVVTLLKERQKEVGTIFVITHNDHLKPLFEQVITVTKNKDGVSTLDEGEKTT